MHVVRRVGEVFSNDHLSGPAVLIRTASVAGEPGPDNRFATAVGPAQLDQIVGELATGVAIERRVMPPDQQVQATLERVVVPASTTAEFSVLLVSNVTHSTSTLPKFVSVGTRSVSVLLVVNLTNPTLPWPQK